jgi:hypothetical protein
MKIWWKALFFLLCIFLVAGCSTLGLEEETSDSTKKTPEAAVQEKTEKPSDTSASNTSTPKNPQNNTTSTAENAFESFAVRTNHEGENDASLMKFIRRLESISQQKETVRLLELIDDDIKYSFGDPYEPGKKGFIRYWKLNNNPKASPLWSELNKILSLGGASDGFYQMPNLSVNYPEGDPFGYMAVVGERVNVRKEPDLNSPVVDQVSWVFVKWNGNPSENKIVLDGQSYLWQPVITPNGTQGYIVKKYLRNPVDYRIVLGQDPANKQWNIITFIAGD